MNEIANVSGLRFFAEKSFEERFSDWKRFRLERDFDSRKKLNNKKI